MASLTPTPRFQFIYSDGDPLFLGKLYTYAAGTDTPLATYTTSVGNVENTNPVILDAYGSASVWLGSSLYKMVLKDENDSTIYTQDNVGAGVTLNSLSSAAAPTGASLIGFLQSGSGAAASTVQRKLQETVSLLDFIPVAEHAAIRANTSTYDATTDINEALQCGAIRVYIPQGTYKVTGALTAGTALHLYGDSAYTSVINCTDNTVNLLTFPNNADFIRLENFQVSFTSKGTGDGIVFTNGNNNLLCSGVNVTNADIGFNSVNITFLQQYVGCRVNTSNTGYFAEGRSSGGSGSGTTVIYDQCYANQCNTGFSVSAIREVQFRQPTCDFISSNTAPTCILSALCSIVQVYQLVAEGTIGANGFGIQALNSTLDIVEINGFACQITATGFDWYIAAVQNSAGTTALLMKNIAGRQSTDVKRYKVVNSSGGTVTVNMLNNDWNGIYARDISSASGVVQEKDYDKLSTLNTVQRFDEFLGDTLAADWASFVGSDPQCVAPAIVADQIFGVARMTTGDDAGGTMALNGAQFQGSTNWRANDGFLVYEIRIVLGTAVTNEAVYIGFTDQTAALEMPFTLAAGNTLTSNASNAVGVLYDTDADTDEWCLVGVATDVDATKQFSGFTPVVNTYEIWRIEVSQTGSATFYRNGVPVGTAMSGAVTASTALCPVVAAFSRGAATRNISWDYILVQGNRS